MTDASTRYPMTASATGARELVAGWPSWWPVAVAVAVTCPLTVYWWNLIATGSITFDWHGPIRWPSVALFVAHAAAVLATGYGDEWIVALLTVGADLVGTFLNLSPSRFVGSWWLPVGAALAAWLIVRGHPGFGALAVNPYVLPHYLLLVLLEINPRRSRAAANPEVRAS